MPKILSMSLVASVILAAGMHAGSAKAMSVATAPASGATTGLVREAAIVCGGNGCNPVHTKAQSKRKFQTLGHG